MSRQVAPPYRHLEKGTWRVAVPVDTCEDCGREVRHPGRLHKVLDPQREICVDCCRMPRVAPSMLYFWAREPGPV